MSDATTETLPALYRPRLGGEGEPCASCGGPLASDQRYCLRCGARRGDARLPFMELLAPPAPAPRPVAPAPVPRRSAIPPSTPLVGIISGIVAAAVLGLGLLAGALIANKRQPQVAAAAATASPTTAAATPAPTAAAPAATTAPESFTPDWPAGQEGWTIQLQTLPKDGTTPAAVSAAKSDASSKGVADVGALDSDSFASLDAGNYVIYSGNYPSKSEADGALDGAKGGFPDAKVVQVSSQAPQEKPAATPTPAPKSPEDAQKNTKNAPPKVESEGTPPPKDNKKAGDGSESETIG